MRVSGPVKRLQLEADARDVLTNGLVGPAEPH